MDVREVCVQGCLVIRLSTNPITQIIDLEEGTDYDTSKVCTTLEGGREASASNFQEKMIKNYFREILPK